MSIEQNEPNPWACEHEHTEPRRVKRSNGVVCVVEQCQRCGRSVRNLKKAGFELATVPWLDEQAERDFSEKARRQSEIRAEVKRQEWAQQQTVEAQAFWAAYNAYLRSDAWLRKRDLVMKRSRGLCEARLTNCLIYADHAHHTDYRHCPASYPGAEEPLFELRAVCRNCHERLTTMDRERSRRGQ